MVPADSVRISRVPTYSGFRSASQKIRVRDFHPLWPSFQRVPLPSLLPYCDPTTPYDAKTSMVWALARSLATTCAIIIIFSSCGYLDVSVPHVCPSFDVTGLPPAGLPHSDIPASRVICTSTGLFAAYHVLHRLREPRHPPSALLSLFILIDRSSLNVQSVLSIGSSFRFSP